MAAVGKEISQPTYKWSCTQPGDITNSKKSLKCRSVGYEWSEFFFRSTYRDVSPKFWKKDWGILYTVKGFYGFAEILLLAIF